jgi:hypothetical protein
MFGPCPDPGAPLGDWWTTRDVAKFLSIAKSTVRAYATRHKMPEPEAYVGATMLWPQQTIKEWRHGDPSVALFALARTHLDEAERVKQCGRCGTLLLY